MCVCVCSPDHSEREFAFETSSLVRARHPNLVALLGCCSSPSPAPGSPSDRMLVYEFVPNGSLDHWLHSAAASEPLDWPLRVHIALGVARG